MTSAAASIYRDIAERTGGDIYIGVVGPVRTGKSTFVKRVMETLVIPNIENVYQKERAKDELPQSSSGKTIMTSEPKFVPEEAVMITPDGTTGFSVRLIDSVGYMIPGALGAEEEGRPRMVTTPWYPEPVPMTQAAELGTQKIMEEHCTIGFLITTDGTINEIPREDYLDSETRAIQDMKRTGKPFIVIVNSSDPAGENAEKICKSIENQHQVRCICTNCLTMQEEELIEILKQVLYEFPVMKIGFCLPEWFRAIPIQHAFKSNLIAYILDLSKSIKTLGDAENNLGKLRQIDGIDAFSISHIDLGSGLITCQTDLYDSLFYEVLSEQSGFQVQNTSDLVTLLSDLAEIKRSYEKVSSALDQVHATGYGIVMPTPEEMRLEVPEIVRKGSNYGVRLKASAPSIHMMRADIETEINPIVGDEKQSQDLLQYLLQEFEDNTEKLWESNIFGKSVYELVNEGLSSKLKRIPEESRYKFQSTLSKVINEDSSSLLCIILT